MRIWMKPPNKKIEPGTRVRILGFKPEFSIADLGNAQLREYQRAMEDKQAVQIVSSFSFLCWKYGNIIKDKRSKKGSIELDNGGIVDIPALKFVEAYLKRPVPRRYRR